jgi:hypothetical protein
MDVNPASSWLIASGSDVSAYDSNPQRITTGAAAFLVGHVGKYILLYNAINSRNIGLFKIAAFVSTTEVLLQGGIYGANLTTETGISWRLLDQAALSAAVVAQQWVLEAPAAFAGSTPAWQVLFTLPAAPSQVLNISGQPFGGWNSTLHTPFLGFADYGHVSDTTPAWYFFTDGAMLGGWTENNAGTGVASIFYVGSTNSFNATSDASPVVQWGDVTSTLFVSSGKHIASDNTTIVNSKGIRLYDPVTATAWFGSLATSPFDLRNMGMAYAYGSDSVGFEEIRGTLRNVYKVSSDHTYKKFLSNSRSVIGMGSGVAFIFNGLV